MEKQHPKLSGGQVVKWKDQDFPSVYSNLIGFGMSPFDITLIFGEIGDTTPTEVTGIPKARIIVSPEQAANLMKLLGLGLATFTKNNGQLRTAGAVDLELLEEQIKSQSSKASE